MPMDLHNPEVSDNKKTEKHFKRTAPRQISNWIIKKPRLLVSNTNVGKYIPSTSNAVIQSTHEVASVQSTNEELQPSNSELNCQDSSSHLDNDKKENGFDRKYSIYNNEYLLQHHLNIDDDDTTEKSHYSINQRNLVGINKSQKYTIIQQQPYKQAIKSFNITKQQSTLQSTNISSKIQHSTMNQTDPTHHVFNNQHNKSPFKHTKVTATHIQTSNKQIIDRNQLPIFSKLVPTTKQKVNINQNVKPAIIHQPSVKDIKCIKYLALLNDHTYAACHMISHLKNIAVTEIGTPSTSAVVVPQSPVLTSSKPIDVPSSYINSISCEKPQVILLLSEDEDEESVEPIITKTETKEALKKQTDKLCLNPKLLEDRLSQKDLRVKDCYTIEGCQSVHNQTSNKQIINRNQLPILSKLVSTTKQKVNINANVKPAIIHQQPVKYVIKCMKCKSLSKEQTCDKCYTFTSLKNGALKKIGTPSTSAVVVPQSPVLTSSKPIDVNKILCSKTQDTEEIKRLEKQRADKEMERINDTIILEDRLSKRYSVIRISDYRMLSTNKFINDMLIEFYLNYWYTKKLSDEDRNRTYVFSTHFYTILAESFNTSDHPSHYTASQIRHNKVKKWTKNVDIFKKDFVFIPINENNHWFMAVVCFPYLSGKVNMKDGTPVDAPDDNAGRYTPPPTRHHHTVGRNEADPNVEDLWLFDMASTTNLLNKEGIDYETDVAVTKISRQIQVKRPCILLFDSLSGGVQRAKITATIRDWLEQEYIAKYDGKEKDFSPQAIKGALLRLPQQPNLTDCGLFMIHFFKRFFERPIVDYTLPIRHLENWFSIDEVVKNCQKRRELQSIILNRMEEQGSILPNDIKLPIIDFTDPQKNTKM